MNALAVLWGAIILFCVISFSLMSIKILYRGIPELREMLEALQAERTNRKRMHQGSQPND